MGGFHLFTLADIPVRVSPWYLILVYFFVQSMQGGHPLMAGLVITVSVALPVTSARARGVKTH
jgi:hypothetical protein